MDDYCRRLDGYEMRRLQRSDITIGGVGGGGGRQLSYMGSSLSSNQASSGASPPPPPPPPPPLSRLPAGGSVGSQRRQRPVSRSSAVVDVGCLGAPTSTGVDSSRLQRMGSSTTDSPSPRPPPPLFLPSSTSAAVGVLDAPAAAVSSVAQLNSGAAPLPPPVAMRRAGSHGRLEPYVTSSAGVGGRPTRVSCQSLLARMGSGDSEQPASASRSGALPTRSTSASTLNSCGSDEPSQDQRSHFSLRSHHSHHSVRSLGGTSQQMSLSALLPRPGTSPPDMTQWSLGRRTPVGDRAATSAAAGGNAGARGRGLWRCVHACRGLLGQQIARKRVEQGVRLFSQNRYHEAVMKWREALRKTQSDIDRFDTLGYLCQAYVHWGKYRELVEVSYQQLEIANDGDDNALRAEAYLNLARGHERLGNLDDALQYCRHSLYNQTTQSRTTGQVHLCLANVYVTYSNFCKAIEHYELSLKVARAVGDVGLELLVFIGMGHVFNVLKDYDKGLQLVAKAFELSKSFHLSDTSMRHKQLALLHLVTPLRKLGRMAEAYECCQDALQMALEAGDRPMNARGLCAMGDILRQKSEGQRAYRRYGAALVMLTDMGDQFGRVLALDGMAKSISLLCHQRKVCDCKPLEAYTRLLDAVTECGSKLLLRNTHRRLADIYAALGDTDNVQLQHRLAAVLCDEMELFCGVCNAAIGEQHGNSLEALPCSHIFHQQCARELLSHSERRKKKRFCPQCRRTLNSRANFVCYDDIKYGGQYPTFVSDISGHVTGAEQQAAL